LALPPDGFVAVDGVARAVAAIAVAAIISAIEAANPTVRWPLERAFEVARMPNLPKPKCALEKAMLRDGCLGANSFGLERL
jgi:hypothetical protein